METHLSIFTWRISWSKEPGGLQFMGSQSQTQLSDLTLSLLHIPQIICITNNVIFQKLGTLPHITPSTVL